MWILLAFSGPLFWAISTHIDKYLVERYFKHSETAVLMVFTALIGILMLPFIIWFQPGTLVQPLLNIVVMIVSGIFYMGAMLFYLRAIQIEEASVVMPLFQTVSLFTFLLGYLVLGETLQWLNAIGALLIIIGALALSLDKSFHFRKLKPRFLAMMMVCTFILALSSVMFKYFAVQSDFWGTIFWNYVGEALFGIGILAIPRYWRQFTQLLKKNTTSLLSVNAANELINLGGGLAVRFASLLAPVALVSAISSTTTLFVFLIGVLLTIFLPRLGREDISRRNLFQKGLAAVLVVVGVILINV